MPATWYESLQEPLDDEERELMDPEMWDWEHPMEGVRTPNPQAILEIRFNHDEIKRVGPAARAEGVTEHEFVKRAALARAPEPATR
jgi:hypothetical protein